MDSTDSASPFSSPDAVYGFGEASSIGWFVTERSMKDEPVELLNGVLITRMPKNPRHRVGTRQRWSRPWRARSRRLVRTEAGPR